jgi:glycosyltransferase involved in cell wall biosynthesis
MIEKGKTRVVFFLPTLECGGTEKNTVNLLKSLSRQQYELSLLLAEKKGDFIKDVPDDIPLQSFGTPGLLNIFFHLISYFRKEEADVFISAFPRFNAVVLLAKLFAGGKTKVIITEHLSFSLLSRNAKTPTHRFIARFLFPYFIKLCYPAADAIICVSGGIAQEISSMMGHAEKVKVIYNPVADDAMLEMARQEVSHQWFGDKAIPIIVMVARLSKTKDQPTLLKALSIILKKRPARLVIIGDGTEKQKLLQLVSRVRYCRQYRLFGIPG